jgi:hypothetical protein
VPRAHVRAERSTKSVAWARVYGDGTRVQRGISGSWHASVIASTSPGAGGRSTISSSPRRGTVSRTRPG